MKKQAFGLGMLVATVEIYTHQVLAMYYLGWDYGFQYYLLCIPVYILLGGFRLRTPTVLISLLIIFSLIICFVMSQYNVPQYNIAEHQEMINFLNLIGASLIITFYIGIISSTSSALNHAVKQSQEDIKLLYQAATIDDMTQLYNRMHSKNIIKMWLDQAYKEKKPFTLAFIDADNFKQINDNLGHETGDAVLQHIAKLLKSKIADTNGLVARWGGEEFLIALPNTPEHKAKDILEDIRATVASSPYTTDEFCTKLTMTIGAVHLANFNRKKELKDLLKTADIAMYEGKLSTKNRLIFRHISQF